jgi:hypothetical protein
MAYTWLLAWGGAKDPAGILCGVALRGTSRAKGNERPGARDPGDPLWPPQRVCRRAGENPPLAFWSTAANVRGTAPKRRQLDKDLPAARVNDGGPQAPQQGSGGPKVTFGRRNGAAFGQDSTCGDMTAVAENRGHLQRNWGGLCRRSGTSAWCERGRGCAHAG